MYDVSFISSAIVEYNGPCLEMSDSSVKQTVLRLGNRAYIASFFVSLHILHVAVPVVLCNSELCVF